MSDKSEQLVVIPLEPLKKGRAFVDWPLHITIVPWFNCLETERQRLSDLLKAAAGRHHQFDSVIGQFEWFGKNQDLHVQLIVPNRQLNDLHLDVFNTLDRSGFPIHQKEYLGASYRPHLIYKPENKLAAGDIIKIDGFDLIKQLRQPVSGTMIKELAEEYKLK